MKHLIFSCFVLGLPFASFSQVTVGDGNGNMSIRKFNNNIKSAFLEAIKGKPKVLYLMSSSIKQNLSDKSNITSQVTPTDMTEKVDYVKIYINSKKIIPESLSGKTTKISLCQGGDPKSFKNYCDKKRTYTFSGKMNFIYDKKAQTLSIKSFGRAVVQKAPITIIYDGKVFLVKTEKKAKQQTDKQQTGTKKAEKHK